MNRAQAIIINANPKARSVAASAARMSTQAGTALQVFEKAGDAEKDLKLLKKVLSSGHRSVIEHQTFGIAFNDVSVFAEQYFIEYRLASFTVKSRRYVDFSDAGYLVPAGLTPTQQKLYCDTMEARFSDYKKLLELGIPKEDARFVFPYCLRSNFFMSVNARELMYMITDMLTGRGSRSAEIRALGKQLQDSFDEIYPGLLTLSSKPRDTKSNQCTSVASKVIPQIGEVELIGQPANAESLLALASSSKDIASLVQSERPRALEILNYTFRIRNCSLACLTHFTRHRMQSPIIPDVKEALSLGSYTLPETVRNCPEAYEVYHKAFEHQQAMAFQAAASGFCDIDLSYFCLSGHQIDFLLTMNARELLHFFKLRTCRRAQWEIQEISKKMLQSLVLSYPELFGHLGPTCLVEGRCPEGKMTCGHPYTREELF